jgi:hypothetical protein
MGEEPDRIGPKAGPNQRLQKVARRHIRQQRSLRPVAERELRRDVGGLLDLDLLQQPERYGKPPVTLS